MQLTFLGAVHTVTGSKYLLTINSRKILIDCGLFQGLKELRLRNWENLPVDPGSIDAVIITHAHIDHTGYLPLLVKNGFKGKIYSSDGTKALCAILLPDSGRLQEEEARLANKYGYSKHASALPLYTEDDANTALTHFEIIDFNTPHILFDDCSFELFRAGHIIGASFIKIKTHDKSILFSGDIGRPHDPVMKPPSIMQEADYIVMESTYGDRLHDTTNPMSQISKVINQTVARGGSIIVPAFAVGRAQSLLYYISQLKKRNEIPDVPVFLDSPMAISASHILCSHKEDHRLTDEECEDLSKVAKYVNSQTESKQLDAGKTPKIIISASGMLEGGRILHHFSVFAPDPKNTILITGYQAEGTRGALVARGDRSIKVHGEQVSVNAEVVIMTSGSAHADYREMLDWLKNFKKPPQKVFVTHGEYKTSICFKEKIEQELGWKCDVPDYLGTVELK
jgi:metallo-beta-lactamase family protein